MAKSSCPKCGNHSFEVVFNSPKGSNFQLWFVQCDSCGCVVGTHEKILITSMIQDLA
ncbi:putative Zn finger protein [Dysgonomonadaceae bacterium PH5-43]|nr:putative Zn finger protein [Dysgonomonadaceae bacterium PH5-43]